MFWGVFFNALSLFSCSCFLINTADRIIRVYDGREILTCGRDGEPEPMQKLQDLVNRSGARGRVWGVGFGEQVRGMGKGVGSRDGFGVQDRGTGMAAGFGEQGWVWGTGERLRDGFGVGGAGTGTGLGLENG